MGDLQICRVCLKTNVKMYATDKYHLKTYYEEILTSKLPVKDQLPNFFCYECATLLYKFHKFKEKCHYGLKVLSEICGPITYEKIEHLYQSDYLKPLLAIIEATSTNVKTYTVKSKSNITSEYKNEIEFVADNEADSDDLPLKTITKTEIDDTIDMIDIWDEEAIDIINADQQGSYNKLSCDSPIHIFVDENKEAVNIQAIELNDLIDKPRKRKKFQMNPNPKNFDMSKWKKYHLTEEEALKQFEAKTEEKYYKTAAYKCEDCLKGFSTENMFKRHKKIRHDKSIGDFECRFCKMRFRMACNLRKHMRSHFIRYECLQCKMVMFENSAILHDEYHSGITKKCKHCGEEFRHQSTYYSHLRTHRSSYVCTLCGSSFVSQIGLNNHKKIKHVLNEIESPSEDEQVNTYCKRCDITFDTRKAYEEHLFHSVMHAESIEDDDMCEDLVAKKILGKKLKQEICSELRINKESSHIIEQMKSRRKRSRRTRKKPTTCHQCGKEFDTQAACMKHHTKEHPGTSFFPSGERHVCEICGASLAPGSVTMHENIHTRKKLHPCDVCGKEFHSSIGLKRHSVTHTGEKPFACTMCEKRFTQSNSMKLHYRTFHLKQPYPKRNRRKKKDELMDMEDLPEESKASSEHSGHDDIRTNVITRMQDDNMHYLTLN